MYNNIFMPKIGKGSIFSTANFSNLTGNFNKHLKNFYDGVCS